jgi:uncharacterized membrane protein YGL010W
MRILIGTWAFIIIANIYFATDKPYVGLAFLAVSLLFLLIESVLSVEYNGSAKQTIKEKININDYSIEKDNDFPSIKSKLMSRVK